MSGETTKLRSRKSMTRWAEENASETAFEMRDENAERVWHVGRYYLPQSLLS